MNNDANLNDTSNQRANAVSRFFHSLERETGEGDFAALADRFAEEFLAAGPEGVKIANRSAFAQGLPQRKQAFDKLRAQPARLVSLESTALDARYMLAKGRWLLVFAPEGKGPVEVIAESTYVVDTGEEPFRIVVYLTSQDLAKVLSERGIMPA